MCGIFFVKTFSNKELIKKEKIDLIHQIHKERGPDEKSSIIKNDWMMIHTRLSVTVPGEGHQPIQNSSETSYMIFNGEIYNYKELAAQYNLFNNQRYSDTDLLFKMIEEIGFRETILKLRGMFAIVYYDLKNQKVYAARDHFGQKPLFFYKKKDTIAFSSTIKALILFFNCEINYGKILGVISKQGKNCPSETLFKLIGGLRAGEIMELDFELKEKSFTYFSHKDIINTEIYRSNISSPFENLNMSINNTMQVHCHTESNIGLLLSGGYDSSMVLKYSRNFKKTDLCLTKLCPGIENIPLNIIPKLLEKYPSDCFFKVITPKIYFQELIDFIKMNFSIPKWGGTPAMRYLFKDIKYKNIKVFLGGDGIDESMMGYNTHLKFLKKISKDQLHSSLSGEPLLSDFSLEDNNKLIEKRNLIENDLKEYISNDEAFTQSFLFQDTLEFLQRCNLPSADLFSMNESIELRSPFVDLEFMKFALNLPLKWKYQKEVGGKYMFKKLAKDTIGDIFTKNKEGTRNYSRLLSQGNFWKLDEFEVIKLFPVLKAFKSFTVSTRFTIVCIEFLIRILDNPEIENNQLINLLNQEGKIAFEF